jgi:serine phosphatase RsbU (regulator of sigma subunit)
MEIRFENEKRQQALERKQFEIELRDAQIRQKNLRYYYMLGALALLMGLVVTIFIAWRQKTRTNVILSQQKLEIEQQRDQISEQKQKITDSILYASRIQRAILPPLTLTNDLFPTHFIFFKPRDVVSGDFYWMHNEGNYSVLVVADCTGHGVPGAFMSMLGISLLNELTGQYSDFDAAKMLGYLRDKIRTNLHQTSYGETNSDGIDLGMVIFENTTGRACYSGGNVPLWLWTEGELKTYNPDRMPVGIYIGDEQPFTNNIIELKSGDTLYMFSDGYMDQFGGPKLRKLMQAGFRTIIESITELPLDEQYTILETRLNEWKGDTRQIDDIIVVGIHWKH